MQLPGEFLQLSQRVGSNPLLVQGPGGNTSMKFGNTMWVKASGTELAEAMSKNIFVEVDCALAVREIDGAGDGTCRAACVNPGDILRPSIETAFHAMLPFRFVVHIHSVAAICHASSVEGVEALASKLQGIKWSLVPYRRPGIPLTRAIREVMGGTPACVYILRNHGLIVCGDEIGDVNRLLDEVESRLNLDAAEFSRRIEFPAVPSGWDFQPASDFIACDSVARSRATSGSYYPDHVVFLGPALPLITSAEIDRFTSQSPLFPAVVIEDVGILTKSEIKSSALAMLGCLQNVLLRIPRQWKMTSLSRDEEMELLNWDAEKYRQALAANRGSS